MLPDIFDQNLKKHRMLYKETVNKELWELLQKLMKDENLKDFNLVGGTALSLMIGHRLSIDIDLFTTKDFNEGKMLAYLGNQYPVEIREMFKNTILMNIGTDINKVKVDILTHQYPLQQPIQSKDGVRLASLQDIGAMKLHAIFQNGSRIKDFVDIYFLLEHHPLKTYFEAYERKYNGNATLAAYGLLHYKNIDWEEKVKMMKGKEKDWNRMKERLEKAVFDPSLKFSELPCKNQNPPKNKGRGFKR